MTKRNPQRKGDARGLWKLVQPEPPTEIPGPVMFNLPRMRYRALEDPFFLGTYKAEPVSYTGRGIVYLFHGRGARQKAQAKAAEINQRDGFV